MSSLSWLDFSDSDRDRAVELISLFREHDTIDELGLLVIWEAIADLLFPGLSTPQTRARYFFFIPWIYQRLERDREDPASFKAQARRRELQLIPYLLESEDKDGTIGKVSRNSLKRLPSGIYWSGLQRLGFRRFEGGQDRYYRALRRLYAERDGTNPRADGDEIVERTRSNWHPGIPPAPRGFPRGTSHTLTREEAEFFRDRVVQAAPNSLFAFLLTSREPLAEAAFPWELPGLSDASPQLLEALEHARNFSEIMHGGQLLYNLQLAELTGAKELVDSYQDSLKEWSTLIRSRRGAHTVWDRNQFWVLIGRMERAVPMQTRLFVEQWTSMVLAEDPNRVATDRQARDMIAARERYLKREHSRFTNPRALQMWQGRAGARQFEYRWGRPGRAIVTDVLVALSR